MADIIGYQIKEKAEKAKASLKENFKEISSTYSGMNLLGNYNSVISFKLHSHWVRGNQMYGEQLMSSPKAIVPLFPTIIHTLECLNSFSSRQYFLTTYKMLLAGLQQVL